jgi:hypothetical protein
MARTISGRISILGGQTAVEGARVRAWDDDDASPDDFMGESVSNHQGQYAITYAGGHWDNFPHWTVYWRPDIYITVDVPHDGQWFRVHKSGVYGNQRLSHDLRVDVSVSLPFPDARTAFGIIRWRANHQPVNGAIVKAYDHDPLSDDDFMGTDTTGTDGKYRIAYSGGHWDLAPHRSIKWRPDIYIQVLLKNNAGQWKVVHKSEVWANVPHREGLELNAFVDPAPDAATKKREPPATTRPPIRENGGTNARLWNRSGGTRYIYLNGSFHNPMFNGETIDLTVPCGVNLRVDAKDRMSDVLNDVTFSIVIQGLCEALPRTIMYEIFY